MTMRGKIICAASLGIFLLMHSALPAQSYLNNLQVQKVYLNTFLIKGTALYSVQWLVNIETQSGDIVQQYKRVGRFCEVIWNGQDQVGNSIQKGSFVVKIAVKNQDTGELIAQEEAGKIQVETESPKAITCWVEPSTVKVKKDALPQTDFFKNGIVFLSGAGNEYVAFQLVVRAVNKEVKINRIELSPLKGKGNATLNTNVEIFIEHYVKVYKPDYPTYDFGGWNIEKDRGIYEGLGLDRPDWWPDALIPFKPFVLKPEDGNQPVWMDLVIPKEAKPGKYTGKITISLEENKELVMPLELEVYPFSLGDECLPSFFPYSLDTKDDKLKDYYFGWFVKRRMNPSLPCDFLSPEADKYLADPRVTSIDINTGDKEELKKIAHKAQEKGWLKKIYVKTFDESGEAEYPAIKEFAGFLHGLNPRLRFMLTTTTPFPPYHLSKELIGSVDIWCPHYSLTPKEFDVSVYKGERWWYINPLLLLDMPGISPRVASWKQANYEISGLYVSHANNWSGNDPYKDPYVPNGTGNGQGYLTYPGEPVGVYGPVSSIRLENLRDGFEDYLYLVLLKEGIETAGKNLGIPAQKIPLLAQRRIEENTGSLISPLATAVFALEEQRKKLAEEIIDIDKHPYAIIGTTPGEDEVTEAKECEVYGWVEEGSQVKINGEPLPVKGNHFSRQLGLAKGFNRVSIKIEGSKKEKEIVRLLRRK